MTVVSLILYDLSCREGLFCFYFLKFYLTIFLLHSYSIIFCFCTTALGRLRYLILTSSLSQNHVQRDNLIFDL